MKRHTNTKTGIFGLVACGLMIALGTMAVHPTWAETNTSNTEVQFTFSSMISLTMDESGKMTIENLNSGTAADSSEITLTVDTNSEKGYYVSATAGTSDTDTNLSSEDETLGDYKFAVMGTQDSKETASAMDDNTWGLACAPGETGDLSKQPYVGLPQDGDDGTSGQKVLTSDKWNGDKKVKCRIGAKAGATMAAGTYKNVVNFYAVAND